MLQLTQYILADMGFFSTVEFYVLLTLVAAAILALCARPSRRGEARQYFSTAILSSPVEGVGDEPHIEIFCRDNGTVAIVRRGLDHIYMSGTLAIAIEVIGFDVRINERITAGNPVDGAATEGVFILDFFAPEYYHIHYTADPTSRMAAFSLHVRPGLRSTHLLKM